MEKSRKNNAINSLRNIKNLKRASKNSSGITLIALVITIVVLIILAGISIMGVTQTGIFDKAKLAKNKYEKSQEDEDKILNEYDNEIGKYSDVSGSRDSVTISKEEYEMLKNINSYSTTEKQIGTWIDGKNIYQRVVEVNSNFTTNTMINCNAESLIKLDGYVIRKDSNGTTYETKCIYTSPSDYIQAYGGISAKNEIYLRLVLHNNDLNSIQKATFIVQYTKK